MPLGSNSNYNNQALAVYQEAMPGYEIVGVTNNTNTPWENTDALHCRTRGVMDFDMLFVDHRDVLHGEQEWQESIPVVSKFIAYSGANLKQDSLLVYYSIDGGTYQVAHMTATGNPDEYVGYITGYQGGSEIDYYVFGADESGHRYTQPVFADLDPHHFTMEAHQPAGELVITPDTLWLEQMGQQRQFNIINETNEAVTIIDVVPEMPSFNLWENTFPYTLQAGETLTVTVDYQTAPGKDTYIPYEILIRTTLGDRIVMGMVLNTSLDSGFVIVGAPVVEFNDLGSSPQQVNMQNRFFGSQIPVTVLSVTENETDYLSFEPQGTLPYTVEPADYFYLDVYVNAMVKGYVVTSFTVHTDQNDCIYGVNINENLLSVNELSSEAKLYPNPTTGQFTVEGANVAKVEVYNLVGQKVHEAEGKTISIDAAEWNKGIYLVNIIEQSGSVVTKKLVVR